MDLNFKPMKSSKTKYFTNKEDYSSSEIPCGHKKI